MSASLHFITAPGTATAGDARTDHLTHLASPVIQHLRSALHALDTRNDSGLSLGSVRLYYAIETAAMHYDLMDPVNVALREFRQVVDAALGSDENRWFTIDLCLADCLTMLRRAQAPRHARLAVAA